jgi:copper chaperone
VSETVITVTGMTCSHCVNAVQEEIGNLRGVHGVQVDLETGRVVVIADPVPSADDLRSAVDAAGYEVSG